MTKIETKYAVQRKADEMFWVSGVRFVAELRDDCIFVNAESPLHMGARELLSRKGGCTVVPVTVTTTTTYSIGSAEQKGITE